jgi:hypothetical protein
MIPSEQLPTGPNRQLHHLLDPGEGTPSPRSCPARSLARSGSAQATQPYARPIFGTGHVV